jgi:hypothetical protein
MQNKRREYINRVRFIVEGYLKGKVFVHIVEKLIYHKVINTLSKVLLKTCYINYLNECNEINLYIQLPRLDYLNILIIYCSLVKQFDLIGP